MVSKINCATIISRSLDKTVGVLGVISLAESHTHTTPTFCKFLMCHGSILTVVKQTRQTSLGIKTLTQRKTSKCVQNEHLLVCYP